MVPVTMPLFTAITAYLTMRALKTRRTSDFGFAGASLGLGMWFYSGFYLFPLVIGFMLVHYLMIQRPDTKKYLSQMVFLALVSLAVAFPVVRFAMTVATLISG